MKTPLLFCRKNQISAIPFNRFWKRFLLVSILFFIGANVIFADTHTWNSATTGGLWTTAGNWTGGVAPVAGDDIVITCNTDFSITAIPSTSFATITVDGSATCTLTGGANAGNFTTFTANTNVNVTGFGSGSFTITGGAVAAGKTLSVAVNNLAVSGTGTFTVNGSGMLSVNSGFTTTAVGKVVVANGGILEWTRTALVTVPLLTVEAGGTFNLSGSAGRNFSNGISIAGKLSFQGTVYGNTGTTPIYSSGSTLEYKQTTGQSIGTEWPGAAGTGLSNIIIDISAGTATTPISTNKYVPGNLNIKTGTLTITYNTYIEAGGSITQTTPAANFIIIGNANAYLYKMFSGNGSFTYPIGVAGIYRPVDLTISGSGSGGTPGVGTFGRPLSWNSDCTPGDYTNCSWKFQSTGFSGGWSYQATLHFPSSDVVGTASNMKVARYNGSTWNYFTTTYDPEPYLIMTNSALNSAYGLAGTTFMGKYCCVNSVAPTGITTNPSPANICPGGSATLTVSGGSLGDGANWQWYTGSCGGTNIGSGSSISVSPGATTTYWVRAEGTCNTTICRSVTVTLNTLSTAPSSASASVNPVCAGSNTTLSQTGGTLGTGAVYNWYSGGCSGTYVGSGSTLSVTVSAATTYYVKAVGTCNTTTCASIFVDIITPPVAPSSASSDRNNFCEDDAGTINLTAMGGSGTTLAWYSNSCGGTPVGTGSPLNIASPSVTTTYYARWESPPCNSPCASITVTVNPLPTAYNVTGGGAYCSGGTAVNVGLSNSTTGVNYQLLYAGSPLWAAVGGITGNPVGFGVQTQAGAYTVLATNATTGCQNTMTGSAAVSIYNCPPSKVSVAINTTGAIADTAAILDISSTEGGILLPRMTNTERDNIVSPDLGLLIYNTGSKKINFYYNGWNEISSSSIPGSTGAIAINYGTAINTTGANPAASAMLDVSSTVKGVLIPRTLPGAIYGAKEGSVIFNIYTNKINYYTGAAWVELSRTQVSTPPGAGSTSVSGCAMNLSNANPATSAVLDVSAQNKAMILPRLTDAQRNALLPATGLIIYNTDADEVEYFDGTSWYKLQ